MHYSQYLQMAYTVETYMPKKGHLNVLEVGSRNKTAEQRTHRQLMRDRDVAYLGIDLLPGHNVDLVMKKPYSFPIPSRTVDVLIAGAVFEHIPFVWITMLEVARVLRPGGQAFILAPSRGHEHNVYDCWRYYPDGYRALAAWSELELRDVFADFPPRLPNQNHFDYSGIDTVKSYWGDSVAVFRKPVTGYSELKVAALRNVLKLWGNARPDLENVPRPPLDRNRERILARWSAPSSTRAG